MNLPNYFLADLPPEAEFTPGMIAEACHALKTNRRRYLAERSTESLLQTLGEVARGWLDPANRFRQFALERGPAELGFSAATLARGLDGFFREVTVPNLRALLVQELGHARRLDDFCATDDEHRGSRAAVANAPALLVQVAAGNLPNPALTSLLLGLLLRSAQFLKCARGTSLLPRLFAHSLREVEPKLGACLEIAEWPGGATSLEDALFAESDCVTATGSDEALAALRARVPARTRFLGYGHRVSFGFVGHETLAGTDVAGVIARAAADVAAWNQLGCLSPHVIYVEDCVALRAEQFAHLLAAELERLDAVEPRGPVPTEIAAAIAGRRAFYEVRAAHSPDTQHWCSDGSTAWTVVFENDPQFQLSCLHRFIYVKPVRDLAEALHCAEPVREHISTVGVAVPEHRARAVALELARWGVSRVCPLGRMQAPPLTWRHDGRPPLADLVTWTDWETERA